MDRNRGRPGEDSLGVEHGVEWTLAGQRSKHGRKEEAEFIKSKGKVDTLTATFPGSRIVTMPR